LTEPVVLDSSVILAAIQAEPGHEQVLALQGRIFVSAVNMAEVRTKLVDKGLDFPSAEQAINLVGVTVVDFGDADAKACAGLRGATRHAGLSLGDRACLALGMSLNASVFTADRDWARVEVPVNVVVIR
jgi:ribonuclease VapC